jgi:hypothetical protein
VRTRKGYAKKGSGEDAFSYREYQKTGGDNVISRSEESQGEKGGGYHHGNAIDRPECRLKISFRDHRPQHAEHCTKKENGSRDVRRILHILVILHYECGFSVKHREVVERFSPKIVLDKPSQRRRELIVDEKPHTDKRIARSV